MAVVVAEDLMRLWPLVMGTETKYSIAAALPFQERKKEKERKKEEKKKQQPKLKKPSIMVVVVKGTRARTPAFPVRWQHERVCCGVQLWKVPGRHLGNPHYFRRGLNLVFMNKFLHHPLQLVRVGTRTDEQANLAVAVESSQECSQQPDVILSFFPLKDGQEAVNAFRSRHKVVVVRYL